MYHRNVESCSPSHPSTNLLFACANLLKTPVISKSPSALPRQYQDALTVNRSISILQTLRTLQSVLLSTVNRIGFKIHFAKLFINACKCEGITSEIQFAVFSNI